MAIDRIPIPGSHAGPAVDAVVDESPQSQVIFVDGAGGVWHYDVDDPFAIDLARFGEVPALGPLLEARHITSTHAVVTVEDDVFALTGFGAAESGPGDDPIFEALDHLAHELARRSPELIALVGRESSVVDTAAQLRRRLDRATINIYPTDDIDGDLIGIADQVVRDAASLAAEHRTHELAQFRQAREVGQTVEGAETLTAIEFGAVRRLLVHDDLVGAVAAPAARLVDRVIHAALVRDVAITMIPDVAEGQGPRDGVGGVLSDSASPATTDLRRASGDDAVPTRPTTMHASPPERRAPARMAVPTWLDQAAAWAWRLLLVGGVIVAFFWVLAAMRVAVVPVLIAGLIAATIHPAVNWLNERGLPRALAAALPLLLIACTFGGIAWLIGQQTADELAATELQTDQVRSEIEAWLRSPPLDLDQEQIEAAERSIRSAMAGGARNWGASQGTLVFTIMAGLALGLVLTFLFAMDGQRMWRWTVRRVDPARQGPFDRAGRAARVTMAAYVRSVVFAGLFDGAVIGIGLWIIGVPLILPLVLFTTVAALFPVIGAITAGLAAAVVALITLGPQQALWVVALTIVVQQLEGNVIVPMLVGRGASIHPAVVLISLTAGGAVAGLAGAFLAVPMAASAIAAVSAFNDTTTSKTAFGST